MALQHTLYDRRLRIPELDASILGPAEHPVAIGRESNAQHEVLQDALLEI